MIEVMVAMGLVTLATLALLSANTFAARAASRSYRRYVAMRLAQQRLDTLMLGDTRQRLSSVTPGTSLAAPFVADTFPQDCTESGVLPDPCINPAMTGWVDIYGRPCTKDKSSAAYQPTCQFKRYVMYLYDARPPSEGDVWNIFIAVSHAPDGACNKPKEGDSQCVVTSAMMTR